jgi:SNF2 family DNA or RNA helicase
LVLGTERLVHAFMNDPKVVVLLANDAAGEGVNLQRAHLMVNFDLPWNPNRLEQRFGRIHRIGQQEVCHLWNLLAQDTREGEVYIQLLEKLDNARKTLGDKVFDVLGQLSPAARCGSC